MLCSDFRPNNSALILLRTGLGLRHDSQKALPQMPQMPPTPASPASPTSPTSPVSTSTTSSSRGDGGATPTPTTRNIMHSRNVSVSVESLSDIFYTIPSSSSGVTGQPPQRSEMRLLNRSVASPKGSAKSTGTSGMHRPRPSSIIVANNEPLSSTSGNPTVNKMGHRLSSLVIRPSTAPSPLPSPSPPSPGPPPALPLPSLPGPRLSVGSPRNSLQMQVYNGISSVEREDSQLSGGSSRRAPAVVGIHASQSELALPLPRKSLSCPSTPQKWSVPSSTIQGDISKSLISVPPSSSARNSLLEHLVPMPKSASDVSLASKELSAAQKHDVLTHSLPYLLSSILATLAQTARVWCRKSRPLLYARIEFDAITGNNAQGHDECAEMNEEKTQRRRRRRCLRTLARNRELAKFVQDFRWNAFVDLDLDAEDANVSEVSEDDDVDFEPEITPGCLSPISNPASPPRSVVPSPSSETASSPFPTTKRTRTTRLLLRVLSALQNVQTLHLNLPSSLAVPLLSALSQHARLRTFGCAGASGREFPRFLSRWLRLRGGDIRILGLRDVFFWDEVAAGCELNGIMVPTLLPNLSTLTGPPSLISALAPGRPISRVCLLVAQSLMNGLKPGEALKALAQTQGQTVREIEFRYVHFVPLLRIFSNDYCTAVLRQM